MSKVLFIGANSDIAKATARIYASYGYDLILAARDVGQLKQFATDLQIRYNCQVEVIQLDILVYDSHAAIYQSIKQQVTGVVVAAGYLGDQQLAEGDFTQSNLIINSNFTGIVSLLNIIANDFEQKKAGFIVAISSVAGERGRKKNYIYGAAKAGLTAYLSGLRNRLQGKNIGVLTVNPGFVATKMTKHLELPAKLTAQPQQIAQAIYIAQQKGQDMLYYPKKWKLIMLIIKLIPERLFKRLDL
ncbi:Oxidoreductase, short-chain dehydrogenase/reductase family [hydrothermal vent metagenome]|uniref:Oxidoreductase, short-chain dehydrogenase/reductase family n=1 Tax=hydrothermal vent metagenome TaxID=652676 RepID=A0A3B0VLM8_9ZZZZ